MSKHGISRRDFLKVGGAAGAALAGAAPLSNLARVGAQADTTINVLTVGDPWDLALQSVVDQFTEMTGIGVNIESLGYPALQARLVNAFLTQSGGCRCHRRRSDVDQPIRRQWLDPVAG